MLNFKVGKTYKDTDGNEWEFVSFYAEGCFSYYFKKIKTGEVNSFAEQKDNSVTLWVNGIGTKIPFVEERDEEKEGHWKIYKKYDCIDTHNQKIISLELIEKRRNGPIIQYRFSGQELGTCYFTALGEIAIHHGFVVYKRGIPKEVKDTINRLEKLINEQRYFQKGQIYKNEEGFEWEFKKRIKTKKGLVAVFENEEGFAYPYSIYRLNNIECTLCTNNKIHFCADESIRNEDASKAVQVKE